MAACLLAAASAQAQVYRFQAYNSTTGLPSNAVYSIFQDTKGYIWFATDGGACRYDGVNYTTFSVPQGLVDASVRAFLEDDGGHLWILTKGGVSRFDGARFTNYTTAQGLAHNEVRCGLRARDGALWFGTFKGLSRFDGRRFTNYGPAEGLPPGSVWTLLEDHEGGFWVGTRGGGLARFDAGRFKTYGPNEGLPNEKVFGLAADPAGGLWLATDGGLAHFDGTRFRRFTRADGLGSELVSSVLLDRHNRVWAGTFGGGISRLAGERFTVFNRTHGLPDNYVTALFKDYEDNVWCGTMWSGAFRFGSERFANYTAKMGIGEGLVSGLAETADGTLWLSSINDGLSSIDPRGAVRRYGVEDGLLEEGLWTVFADSRGRVWTAGLKGVSRHEGGSFKSFTLEQMGAKDRINAIIEDRRGRICFACAAARSTGIIAWDGRSFTVYSTDQGLAHNQVNSFARDRAGRLWIGTEDGLSRFDGETFVNYRVADGLPNKRVFHVHEDEAGHLWVGTSDGLARFDGRAFRTYRTEDGLVDNVIQAVTSRDGIVWVGTPRGLSAFDGKQFRNYTVQDGLLSHEVSTASFLWRRDGSLWFGTSQGAARYQPGLETTLALPPKVHLSGIAVRDRPFDLAPALSLAHDQNRLTFEYLGLSFTDETAVRYSYLMEGFDPDWSRPTDQRSARFTNVPPGRYRFLVKARSAAGLWSEPASVTLVIRPPYWQTWWFRLCALTLLGALAYAGYAWRIRTLEERHRQLIGGLHQLLDSIRVINSRLDLATVLQNIAAESAQLVDGEPGGIGLVEGDRVLFKRLWLRDHWEESDLAFPLGEGIAGRVAATGRSHIVNDARSDPDVAFPELIDKYGFRGIMDVPILDRSGRVVGVFDVRRGAQRAPFGEQDRQLLESLAHQAAVAIENAGLYGALEEKTLLIEESLREIERLYKSEREVTRALQELDRMKTDFMVVTAHEVRTPLTLLRGNVEVLLEGFLGAVSDTQKGSLGICLRALDRLIATFNEILDMLQLEERRVTLRLAHADLASAARSVLAEMAPFVERRRQRVTVEASAELPEVVVDAEKMRVVLVNLIGNAIKFTPDGGQIGVRMAMEADGFHLTVEDSGIGIEPAELPRIFEKFYTGREPLHHTSGTYEFRAGGAGLGLAITKGYVEAHGGRIWAESAGPGRGSRFHVVLSPVRVAGEATAAEIIQEA